MKITARAIWAGVVFGLAAGGLTVVWADDAASGAGAVETPARPADHELLVRAIRERRMLHFAYNGHARRVEPHAYGVSATGEAVLHGYQTAGGSVSEPPPGWRTFTVAEMREIVVAEAGFSGPRKSYASEALKLDPLWAEISAAERTKSTE